MSHVQEFFRVGPAERDHIPAFRIAVGVALPLLTLLALGRLDLAIYAAFGAFTGIYARNETPRSRVVRQSIAGGLLTACVAVGATISALGGNVWVLTLVTSLVSGAGAVVAARVNLRPGGSIFFIFATAAVGSVPDGAAVWLATLVAATSAGICVALGAIAHLAGERAAQPQVPLVTEHFSRRDLLAHAARFTVAPIVAGVLGIASTGLFPLLSHPYWAMVAAVAPITPPHRTARIQRGVHRIVGTLGGVVITGFLLSFPVEPWQLVVWVIVLQFLAEVYVGRNYSLALLFITPLALIMTQIGNPQPVVALLSARAVETVIGAAVGLAVVILGFRDRAAPEVPLRPPAEPFDDVASIDPATRG